MNSQRPVIEIALPGRGTSWTLPGPDVTFRLHGVRRVEALDEALVACLPRTAGRLLILLTGNAPAVPAAAAAYNPEASVEVFELDRHDARLLEAKLAGLERVRVIAGSDPEPADGTPQTGIVLVRPSSDRLLMFDLIERLCMILPDGSRLLAAVAHNRAVDFTRKLARHCRAGRRLASSRAGFVFSGLTRQAKHGWTPRLATFSATTAQERITLSSRPGVFCHGRVDAGGLALAESVEAAPQERVLELGCGAGLVGLLLAARWRRLQASVTGRIVLVDSNARAIACARQNIAANGFDFVQAEWTDAYDGPAESFDVVVGNPPYFAEHRIGRRFIETAWRVLRPGGRLYLVSKHGDTIRRMAESSGFTVESRRRRGYDISVCQKAAVTRA